MTRRLFPRRLHAAAPSLFAVATALGLSASAAPARAQDPAPGTLDDTFNITRVRNPAFIPAQTNFTPFALALQPGQDPVTPGTLSNVREIPAAQTKLLLAGDAATLYRTFLTRTIRATTSYDDDGVPVTTFTGPFRPGDIDATFFTSPSVSNGFGNGNRITYALAVNADGGVLVGGLFGLATSSGSVFAKQDKNFILLNFNGDTEITNNLDADGNVTSTTQGPFNTNVGAGANDAVLAILRRSTVVPGESEGRILVGGQFIRFAKLDRGRVVQLLPDGSGDADFNRNLGTGANGIVFSLAEAVGPGVDASGLGFFGRNGQTYVCGDFDQFNGSAPGKLVRLNADGTRDTTFAPRITGRAIAVAVQPDGLVLVGGDLDTINGTAVNNLARLNLDGSLDPVFLANASASLSSPNNIPPTSVYVLRVQADGRILVGGNYLQLDGTSRRYLGRLNADGTLDGSFDAGNILSQATQQVVEVTRDPSLGRATDLVYAQTRADRKEVPGDEGFFPNPVRRLFGDNTAASVAALPVGAPLVRIGADGPTATVGDLTPRPDIAADPNASRAVPNPGVPGLFRVTRAGDLTNDLTVRLKVVNGGGAPALFNSAYSLQLLISETNDLGVVVPALDVPLANPRFDVVIPAGESTVSFLVTPRNDGIAQGDQTVTLKVKASADGSYSLRADQRAATVTILANNL